MELWRATLDVAALSSIPDDEKELFFGLAHFANEHMALRKLFIWTDKRSEATEAEQHGQATMHFIILRLLVGKLREALRLLERTFFASSRIRESYGSALSEPAQVALVELRAFMGQKSLLLDIRNDFSFHYSPEKLNAALPAVAEDLLVYASQDGQGNNLYYFAEVLATMAMLDTIDRTDREAAHVRLNEQVWGLSSTLSVLIDALLTEFLKRNQTGLWEGQAVRIEIADPKRLLSVYLPWFTDMSGI